MSALWRSFKIRDGKKEDLLWYFFCTSYRTEYVDVFSQFNDTVDRWDLFNKKKIKQAVNVFLLCVSVVGLSSHYKTCVAVVCGHQGQRLGQRSKVREVRCNICKKTFCSFCSQWPRQTWDEVKQGDGEVRFTHTHTHLHFLHRECISVFSHSPGQHSKKIHCILDLLLPQTLMCKHLFNT